MPIKVDHSTTLYQKAGWPGGFVERFASSKPPFRRKNKRDDDLLCKLGTVCVKTERILTSKWNALLWRCLHITSPAKSVKVVLCMGHTGKLYKTGWLSFVAGTCCKNVTWPTVDVKDKNGLSTDDCGVSILLDVELVQRFLCGNDWEYFSSEGISMYMSSNCWLSSSEQSTWRCLLDACV